MPTNSNNPSTTIGQGRAQDAPLAEGCLRSNAQRRIRIARRILQMATDERIKAFARTYISERTS